MEESSAIGVSRAARGHVDRLELDLEAAELDALVVLELAGRR